MARSSLLLSSWLKPQDSPRQDAGGHDEKRSQHRDWAPSQVIRLQRLERQERESFARVRDEMRRDSILAAQVAANNNDNDNDNESDNCMGINNNTSETDDVEAADDDMIQDFDVDEIFHLSPTTCPNMRGPAPSEIAISDASSHILSPESNEDTTTALKLKIFTGSWNMAARDPFADKKGQYIGDAEAASALTEFLPLGYDVYVVGTQEKVASEHFHTAMLARLHSAPDATPTTPTDSRRYVRLDLSAPTHPADSSRRRVRSRANTDSFRDSVSRVRSRANTDSFRDSASRVSSFCLVSSGTDTELGAHSPIFGEATEPQQTSRRHQRARASSHEVRGRGDGAFLHSKATSMAIYVAAHLASAIEVVRTGAHKFSLSSGSKGGIGVMVRFAGCEQTITFVNCHLEANRPALRRQQLEILTKKLPRAMGFEEVDSKENDTSLDLATCSDHVVWMGDFNYRIHSLDGETVLGLLASHRHMELHDRYDSMKDDVAFVGGMQRFREPKKWPSFYPTYKKLPDRDAVVGGVMDSLRASEANPDWPLSVYRVRYREPFYKGGRVKARVPGWCDRILFCSAPAWRSCLEVERVPCALQDQQPSEQNELRDNYRSVNDTLRGSDHSPVFCTFQWTVGELR